MIRRPPRSPLFPSTTLFRSGTGRCRRTTPSGSAPRGAAGPPNRSSCRSSPTCTRWCRRGFRGWRRSGSREIPTPGSPTASTPGSGSFRLGDHLSSGSDAMRAHRLILVALLGAALTRAAGAQAVARIAFVHATVIDVEQGRAVPGMTVVVENGRITALGADAGVTAPRGARVIDASGKYLSPGLWDMHVHAAMPGLDALFLPPPRRPHTARAPRGGR